MSNREENLKKISDELEMMSDDELEKIAGGGILDLVKKALKDACGWFGDNVIKPASNGIVEVAKKVPEVAVVVLTKRL